MPPPPTTILSLDAQLSLLYANAFCITIPMYFVCNGKNADGNYLFSNPWHEEMVVSSEGLKVGDELIGKCVYTSLIHFDGLYYVNT